MLIKVQQQIEYVILNPQGQHFSLSHIPNDAPGEAAVEPGLHPLPGNGQISAKTPVELHPQPVRIPGSHRVIRVFFLFCQAVAQRLQDRFRRGLGLRGNQNVLIRRRA